MVTSTMESPDQTNGDAVLVYNVGVCVTHRSPNFVDKDRTGEADEVPDGSEGGRRLL